MRELLRATGARCLQLHGNESPDTVGRLMPHAYKAVRVGSAADAAHAAEYPGEHLLVDAKVTGKLGGTGHTCDWSLVEPGERSSPSPEGSPHRTSPSHRARPTVQVMSRAASSRRERVARTRAAVALPTPPAPLSAVASFASARSPATVVLERRPVTEASVPGYFGPYGGRFVAETLVPALEELALAMTTIMQSDEYKAELGSLLTHYVGRPTPLGFGGRLSPARS
jgi:hypothetical protein